MANLDRNIEITDSPFARAVFGNTRWAWIWLLARLYVGYEWLEAGWAKLHSPAWIDTGLALKGFWTNAIKVPPPPARPPVAYDWYRSFLEMLLDGGHHTWFAKLIVFGELAIGIALVLGITVGIAAFFGAFLNWNFMMAGTASINPVLLVLSVLLMLAWKTAGWFGADRWILPLLGTPWAPGRVFAASRGSGTSP